MIGAAGQPGRVYDLHFRQLSVHELYPYLNAHFHLDIPPHIPGHCITSCYAASHPQVPSIVLLKILLSRNLTSSMLIWLVLPELGGIPRTLLLVATSCALQM